MRVGQRFRARVLDARPLRAGMPRAPARPGTRPAGLGVGSQAWRGRNRYRARWRDEMAMAFLNAGASVAADVAPAQIGLIRSRTSRARDASAEFHTQLAQMSVTSSASIPWMPARLRTYWVAQTGTIRAYQLRTAAVSGGGAQLSHEPASRWRARPCFPGRRRCRSARSRVR